MNSDALKNKPEWRLTLTPKHPLIDAQSNAEARSPVVRLTNLDVAGDRKSGKAYDSHTSHFPLFGR